MPRPLFKGSMIQMPGVPAEDENKSRMRQELEKMYPATPPMANDESAMYARQDYEKTKLLEQQDPEQTLQQLAAEPSAKEQAQQQEPESDLDRYARLSQEAERAAPTEQDVLQAGFRQSMAQSRAETMPYLQQMAETAFYKPDYSEMTKVAQAESEKPDIQLTAKQQAQKRLEGLAESARKKALLPGEMERQKTQSEESKLRLEALKQASALKTRSNEPASESELAKFNKNFGSLGQVLPENTTRGELSEAYSAANKLLGEYKTKTSVARIGAESREGIAESRAQSAEAARQAKTSEKEAALQIPGVGTAITPDDAKKLKTGNEARLSIMAGIDEISKNYGKLDLSKGEVDPEVIQKIGLEGKNLVMQFKERYGLGAPQAAELRFLFSLSDTDPMSIGRTLLSDKFVGTNVKSKLESLKNIVNRDWNIQVKNRTRSSEPSQEPQAGKQPGTNRRKATSADDLP